MLVLPAELTHVQAEACLRLLKQTLRSEMQPQVLVDAAALTRFDSASLAVLLACRRECLAEGKGFAVIGLPARLRELASLYGVQTLMHEPDQSTVSSA